MTPTTIAPYRRSALWALGWSLAIASWGFAESLRSRFTLIAYALAVLYGYLLDRIMPLRRFDPASLAEPPDGSVIEKRHRTVLATLGLVPFFVPFVLLGLLFPVVGAIGGGAILGFALGWLRVFLKILSAERRDGWRLYFEVPRRWTLRGRHRPSCNFRVPSEASRR